MSNDISLLTTLRYVPTSPSGIPLLRRHLDRLSRAADCFGEGSGQYEYGGDEVLREKIQETCEGKVVGDWRVCSLEIGEVLRAVLTACMLLTGQSGG